MYLFHARAHTHTDAEEIMVDLTYWAIRFIYNYYLLNFFACNCRPVLWTILRLYVCDRFGYYIYKRKIHLIPIFLSCRVRTRTLYASIVIIIISFFLSHRYSQLRAANKQNISHFWFLTHFPLHSRQRFFNFRLFPCDSSV